MDQQEKYKEGQCYTFTIKSEKEIHDIIGENFPFGWNNDMDKYCGQRITFICAGFRNTSLGNIAIFKNSDIGFSWGTHMFEKEITRKNEKVLNKL